MANGCSEHSDLCPIQHFQPSVEMISIEIEEKGDDDTSDINGATSNQFQETSDIISDNSSQGISMETDDDYIQESVRILLGCEEGASHIHRYSSLISLVPSVLRDHNPESFNPKLVSIGPLHHEDENLKVNEGFKKGCMRVLFDDLGSPPEETLVACLRKVNESIRKIRTCYAGISLYNDHELARIMVMDGCFILIAFSLVDKVNELLWIQILRDLLLVENQIPFFVLEDIFDILIPNPNVSLIDRIKPILHHGHRSLLEGDLEIPTNLGPTTHDVDHILGLLHKCYHPEFELSTGPHNLICNVLELEKVGVSFKPNQDGSWLLAIEIEWWYVWFSWFSWFWVKPTLRLPVMVIEDDTETILRNIIAYEQTTKAVKYFTSYAIAIDDLVDSGHDIAKLVESEVIINRLGSNEAAANMINSVGKNVIVRNFYNHQWKTLKNYYNGYWPRNIARLRRTYFNNPWNIIALTAGIILFLLTMTQTYFAINPIKNTLLISNCSHATSGQGK